jgi:hypothetical protein
VQVAVQLREESIIFSRQHVQTKKIEEDSYCGPMILQSWNSAHMHFDGASVVAVPAPAPRRRRQLSLSPTALLQTGLFTCLT